MSVYIQILAGVVCGFVMGAIFVSMGLRALWRSLMMRLDLIIWSQVLLFKNNEKETDDERSDSENVDGD